MKKTWNERYQQHWRRLMTQKAAGLFDGDVHDVAVEAARLAGGRGGRLLAGWQWFDGKKTTIGAVVTLGGEGLAAVWPLLPDVLQSVGVEADWTARIISIVGRVMIGVGVLHKVFKVKA